VAAVLLLPVSAACGQYTLPTAPVPVPTPAPAPLSVKLMIFGGEGHKTYLGCLNCSEYSIDSVFNTFGDHGSTYSAESILNHFGQFGSEYGMYSPCNSYASGPPVVVDGNGAFYGTLTLNQYRTDRQRNERVNAWLHE
jgi:hypothetical protein